MSELGKVAYEAYCVAVGGKDWQGLPLKTWDELRELPQGRAWEAAAQAVADQTGGNWEDG